MNAIKGISSVLTAAMFSGCASMSGVQGPGGPTLVGSGRSTEYEQYAEVGVEFSSMGDFVALISPNRWKSPVATGGTLSWLNPGAWSEDPGRTGRILVGEVVIAGGAVAAASAGGGGGDTGGGIDAGTSSVINGPTSSNPGNPPPPPE